jgi:hypothetical protein
MQQLSTSIAVPASGWLQGVSTPEVGSDSLSLWCRARPPSQLACAGVVTAAPDMLFCDWRFGVVSAADIDIVVGRVGSWCAVLLSEFGTAYVSHVRFPEAKQLVPEALRTAWQTACARWPRLPWQSFPVPPIVFIGGAQGPIPSTPLLSLPDPCMDPLCQSVDGESATIVRRWELFNFDTALVLNNGHTPSQRHIPDTLSELSPLFAARVLKVQSALASVCHPDHLPSLLTAGPAAAILTEPLEAVDIALRRTGQVTNESAPLIGRRTRARLYPFSAGVLSAFDATTTVHQLRHAVLAAAIRATAGYGTKAGSHSMDPVALAAALPERDFHNLPGHLLHPAPLGPQERWRVIYLGLMAFHDEVCGCESTLACWYQRIAVEVCDCRLFFRDDSEPSFELFDYSSPYPPDVAAVAQLEVDDALAGGVVEASNESQAAVILHSFALQKRRADTPVAVLQSAAAGDLPAVTRWATRCATGVVQGCFDRSRFCKRLWQASFASKTVVKSTRFIFNAIPLNAFLRAPPLLYPSVFDFLRVLRRGWFMCTLDIKSGFSGIVMTESHRKYLCFRGPDGKVYRFRRLAFGLSVGPFVFVCFSALLTAIFRARGIPAICTFIDDFLLAAATRAALDEALAIIETISEQVGVQFSTTKRQGPATSIIALGICIDTEAMRVSIPADKWCTNALMLACVEQLLRNDLPVPVPLLRSLAGKLRWACQLTSNAYTTMAAIWSALARGDAHSSQWLPAHQCRGVLQSVQWWLYHRTSHSVPLIRPVELSAVLWESAAFSDASGSAGFGAIMGHDCIYGRFDAHWRQTSSSTHLEMYAVLATAVQLVPRHSKRVYIHRTDNSSVVSVIAKASQQRDLNQMSSALASYLESHDVDVVPFFTVREDNQLADALAGSESFDRAVHALSEYAEPLLHHCREQTCPGLRLFPCPQFTWKGGEITVIHRCSTADCHQSCGADKATHPVPYSDSRRVAGPYGQGVEERP